MSGKLEYHIPERYDDTRPAFVYTHVKHDMRISEHPLASRLPRPASSPSSSAFSSKPTVTGTPQEFQPLMRRADGPRSMADYCARDEPQLSLHVESFADATLVSLSWPHTLLDGMGRRELLTAWTAVLAGREGDVKPLHGVDEDPLASFGVEREGQGQGQGGEPYVLADKRLSRWQMLRFGLRFRLRRSRGPESSRMLRVPAAYMKTLHASALSDLEAEAEAEAVVATAMEAGEGGEGTSERKRKKKPFVSEGDVLSAWVARLIVQHTPRLASSPDRTVVVMNAFGLRWRLADDLLPADRAYVGNAVRWVYAHLRTRDLAVGAGAGAGAEAEAQQPLGLGLGPGLGRAAAAVRRSIAEQGTRAQLEAGMALEREAVERTGSAPLFGDGGMVMVAVSNWTKARFFDTDFSAAVVAGDGSGGGGSSKAGRPSYIHTAPFIDDGLALQGVTPIIGKDGDGNYWLQPTLEEGVWDGIQKTLEGAS